MKLRMVRILIAGGLVLLLSAGVVSAASQRVFPDVQVGNWAEKDLAEMKAKGFVAGYKDGYRPNEKLSREQVVAMLLRVVGLGGSKPQQGLEQHNKNNAILWHKNVSPWAKEAIAVAWEKGIIPEEDLSNFRPTQPVKRHELAVFIVRAMGMTPEAENSGGGLTFSDAGDIPEDSRGSVQVTLNKKIFTGYSDNTFRPNDVLTRLHIAAILARIDNLMDNSSPNVVKGEVVVGPDLSGTMAIKNSSGEEKVYTLSSKVFVYDGRNSAVEQLPSSVIMAGHQVELVLDSEGSVIYAEILAENEETTVSGNRITGAIAFTPDASGAFLTIINNSQQNTYPVKNGASVKINGNSSTFAGLEGGQEVTLTIQGGQITAIVAKDANWNVVGNIKGFSTNSVTVETEDGLGYQFSITGSTEIRIGGETADLDGLAVGQEAEITAKNLTATKISVGTTTGIVEGVISDLTFSPKWAITVTTDDGYKNTYSVSVKCDVERDNDDVTFVDLAEGDKVELKIRDSVVTGIEAESQEEEAEGTVKKITIEDQTYITIEDEDGDDFTYQVRSNARIRRDGRTAELQDVKAGDYVEMDIEGNKVTKIVVKDRIVLRYFTGEIEDINGRTDTIIITTDDDETVIIEVSRNTMIIKFGDEIDLDDLEEGDVITVTGKMDGNIVDASGIMVISADK